MYYTSNERDYYSLSTGIFFSENKHESKKRYREMYFLDLIFLIVHISTHNIIVGLKFCIHVGNIHVERTVSQILFLCHSFYFMIKNGKHFIDFF